jgi:hypothetical protein
VLFVVLVALSANGCGQSKLDRDTAKNMLVAALKAGQSVTNEIETGRLQTGNAIPESARVVLTQKGMITVVDLPPMTIGFFPTGMVQIELTPEGRKYIVESKAFIDPATGNTVMYNRMRMANEQIVSITGLLTSPTGDSAQVEFTWQYANLTPFGEVAPMLYTVSGRLDYSPDRVFQGTVTFKKYDDGWRLPDGWSLPRQRTGYEQIKP